MSNYIKQMWKDAIVDELGNVIDPGTLITKERMEHIEEGIASTTEGDIDCGLFTDGVDPALLHNVEIDTHQNLIIDGNEDGRLSSKNSLQDHEIDPLAHSNLIVDGNQE